MLPGPLQKIINTFRASLAGFRERPGLMLRSLGISVLLQVIVVLFYYCLGMALGLPVPLLAYFVIVPIATIVMMLPIAINGIGLREGVFVSLLSVFDFSASQAIAFAWLEYVLFLFYGMIGGVVYALRR